MFFKFIGVSAGVVFAVALVACGRPEVPPATQADAARAAATWPEITVAELNQGRTLYNTHCSGCHLPVAPAEIAAAEWPRHIVEMKERANLDDASATSIERYLVTIATRPTAR